MKKKKSENPPKPKEFVNAAFSALKGVQTSIAPPPPVKTAAEPPRKATVSDDLDLFLLAMSGVERLGAKPDRADRDKPITPVKAVVRKIEEVEQKLFLEAIGGLKLDVKFEDSAEEPDEPAKPRPVSRLKQLRRGTIRIDYELDLHGLTKDEALESLDLFIKGACRRGQKAVMVITGKGLHSPVEPVIRNAVEKWLSNEGKQMVSEFFSPPREMGGDGAFAVFIRSFPETAPERD
ncbi:MAG: Smr/MutS family protein [Geobacteraceae bacterium]|nr:Smr/MutS family protein [Geobacteraceae bacterium]